MSNVFTALNRGLKTKSLPSLSGVNSRGSGWTTLIRESYAGAFQADVQVNLDVVLAQSTVFACHTLITSDIGKIGLNLMQEGDNGISAEVSNAEFSPVLRKPNHYQTRQQFIEQWVSSKLKHGNAYILKWRDNRNVVTQLYVLDPNLVRPMVAQNGDVYYQIQQDWLSQVPEGFEAIPASEMIHDRFNCLFHPLVGLSPIFASGLAGAQALNIQKNSAKFFENMCQPGGVLTAPSKIGDEAAARIKKFWEDNFTGNNRGRVAVLGDGLTYEQMAVNAVDAQLVEQWKISAEQVCSAFHVPAYMVGAAPVPATNNVEALSQSYYSQCLQTLIEAIEACLDDGLALPNGIETEFDIDDLLRMDKSTQAEALTKLVKGSIMMPDEAREKLNLPPTPGGNTIYMQQQNYSIAALNKRDTSADPFGKPGASKPAAPTPAPDQSAKMAEEMTTAFLDRIQKGLQCSN